MDPLSSLIDLADAQCTLSGAVLANGTWGVQMPAPRSLKLLIVRSAAWFLGEAEFAFYAEPGDVVVLQRGRYWLIGSSPSFELGGEVTIAKEPSLSWEIYSSPDCIALACHVTLNEDHGRHLLGALPMHIVVRSGAPYAQTLRALYEQLVEELRSDEVGSSLAVERLTQLILITILRAYSSSITEQSAFQANNWVKGSGNTGLTKALHAMHRAPAQNWTLAALADIALMSRTSFAEQFRLRLGDAPITYLRNMRMAMAVRALENDLAPVAAIGRQLGYESESAFSAAFKKTMKVSPKQYRDRRHQSNT
ncbi:MULTISPECIES: AraC family transcriptional regulator [Pseudomonas]|uniref:AraC family transcriptional regulator n=1 Tax=Pseudomonas lactis TaxID=1615674 RepID=A0A921NL47_9PSED|nr:MULTISPECIES: AraC family transcriptional regulator [Pseudomonas]HJH20320.1 AraC family transcriptional regulator [Pseudomonas lactis]